MITFTLKGKMLSGKNRIIVTRSGQRFPEARFKAWRSVMVAQLQAQRPLRVGILFPFGPVGISIDYYPSDRIQRDCTGIMDALWHIMGPSHAGIVGNDAQFKAVRWSEHEVDRTNPRAEIKLDAITI